MIESAAIVSAAVFAGPANAAIYNFFNGSDLFATLTTSGGTNFDLHLVGTGNTAAFINDLFLDGPNGTYTANDPQAGGATPTSATYCLNAWNASGGGNCNSQNGIFDWMFTFENANNSNRLTTDEHAYWSITPTDSEVWDPGMIHINAWDGVNSIKLDACVDGTEGCDGGGGGGGGAPEPGTLALVGLALAGAGWIRRRRHEA